MIEISSLLNWKIIRGLQIFLVLRRFICACGFYFRDPCMGICSASKWLLVILLLVTPAVTCMADDTYQESKAVCFRHKTRDTVKTDCVAIQGKHDVKPVCECFDEKSGKYIPFDPGNKWEPIDASDPLCKTDSIEPRPRVPRGEDDRQKSHTDGN
jgi:hypothetical protein